MLGGQVTLDPVSLPAHTEGPPGASPWPNALCQVPCPPGTVLHPGSDLSFSSGKPLWPVALIREPQGHRLGQWQSWAPSWAPLTAGGATARLDTSSGVAIIQAASRHSSEAGHAWIGCPELPRLSGVSVSVSVKLGGVPDGRAVVVLHEGYRCHPPQMFAMPCAQVQCSPPQFFLRPSEPPSLQPHRLQSPLHTLSPQRSSLLSPLPGLVSKGRHCRVEEPFLKGLGGQAKLLKHKALSIKEKIDNRTPFISNF